MSVEEGDISQRVMASHIVNVGTGSGDVRRLLRGRRINRLRTSLLLSSYASLKADRRRDYDRYGLGFEAYIDKIAYDIEMLILKMAIRNPSVIELIDQPLWRKNAKVNTLDVANLIEMGLTKIGCSDDIIRKVVRGEDEDNPGIYEQIDACLEKVREEISEELGIEFG